MNERFGSGKYAICSLFHAFQFGNYLKTWRRTVQAIDAISVRGLEDLICNVRAFFNCVIGHEGPAQQALELWVYVIWGCWICSCGISTCMQPIEGTNLGTARAFSSWEKPICYETGSSNEDLKAARVIQDNGGRALHVRLGVWRLRQGRGRWSSSVWWGGCKLVAQVFSLWQEIAFTGKKLWCNHPYNIYTVRMSLSK